MPELREENEEINMKTIVLNVSPIEVMSIASGFQDYIHRDYFPKITPTFKCLIYCRNKWPLIAKQFIFRKGKCIDEVRGVYGYTREEAEKAFSYDIMNGKICGEFICDGYKKITDFSWDIFEWSISNVEMYDTMREIKDFGIKKAPARYLILKEQTEHVKKPEQFGKVEQLQKSKGENENEQF